MAEREHHIMAVNLIARWLPKAAALLVYPTCDAADRVTEPYDQFARRLQCMEASKANMAACARIFLAAGRCGAQRLAVAVIEAENRREHTSVTFQYGPDADSAHRYRAVVRALLLFAATTAREFVLTHYTQLTLLEEEALRCVAAFTNRPYTQQFTRTVVAADADAEGHDETTAKAVGSSAHGAAQSAPLTVAYLKVFHASYRGDWTAASALAGMLRASMSPPSGASAGHHPYDVVPGELAAALRPRALTIEVDSAVVEEFVPWIQRQDQLRHATVIAGTLVEFDAIVGAVYAARSQLEDLRWKPSYLTEISISNALINASPVTPRFPGLRVLHVPALSSVDLQRLPNAVPVLEELACGQEQDVAASDWAHLLSHMTRLRSLTIDAPRDHVPAFYQALTSMDHHPACPLHVLSCRFPLTRDVTHAVLNAVARHFPDLESMALPAEIFNALALVESGEMAKYGDEAAKTELRRAIMAATRRCKDVVFVFWSALYNPLQNVQADARLSVDALGELLRLLPNLQPLGPISIRGADYLKRIRQIPGAPQQQQAPDTPLWLLGGLNAAQSADVGESGNIEVSQVQKLHLTGPLSGEDLAKVTRACPNLRELRCEYGGPRPRLQMDYHEMPQPELIRLVGAAVFIEWLRAILDVSAAECSHCNNPKVLNVPTPAPLPRLRRLHVAKPPFDGEDDAASMDALARLRAHHSRLLITFDSNFE